MSQPPEEPGSTDLQKRIEARRPAQASSVEVHGSAREQDEDARGSAREQSEDAPWEETVMSKRPWRLELFEQVTRRLETLASGQPRVLELAAGPGALARYVLEQLRSLPHYALLDVSPAQHELARERLKSLGARVSFVERDFKQPTWNAGLGPFDAVVALFCAQTSHGLRDPRQDVALHTQVRSVLSPIGVYLLADYVPGSEEIDGDPPAQPGEEQEQNLKDAGFARVERLVERSGVVLYAAR